MGGCTGDLCQRELPSAATTTSRSPSSTATLPIAIGQPGFGAGICAGSWTTNPSGSLTLYQKDVNSDVTIMSSLTSLEGAADGNKWHVHRFPTRASGGVDDGGCGAGVTGGHYDPTFKVGYADCVSGVQQVEGM